MANGIEPQLGQSLNNLLAQQQQSRAAQETGIAQMQQRLAQAQSAPMPVDLTALAQLTDTWTGSNFAQQYRPPETNRERKKTIQALQNQIDKGRNDLSEMDMQNLRTMTDRALQYDRLAQGAKQHEDRMALENKKLELMRIKQNAPDKPLDQKDILDMRTKIDKSEDSQRIKGIIQLNNGLNEYAKVVQEYGVDPTGVGAAKLSSAYSKLATAYAKAEGLGALAGPDLGLVHDSIAKSGGIGAFFQAASRGGVEGVMASIRQMRSGSKNDFDASMQTLLSMGQGLDDQVMIPVKNYQKQWDQIVSPKERQEPPGGKQTVTQGGYEYKWNPDTGKYE